jgi:predicted deacylase
MHALVFLALLFSLGCNNRNPKIYFVPAEDVEALALGGILGSHDSGYEVAVSAEQEDLLKRLSPNSFDFSDHQASAYSFTSMERKLEQLSSDYEHLATLDTYGTSPAGRPLYVLTLSNKFNTEHKPEYIITGATHGNEVITVDAVLGLADKLLQGFGSDQRLTNFLNYKTIHFIPAVCVDSYVARTRSAEGRDPNRDYPYPSVPNRNSVGCIKNIIKFFDDRDIVATLDFHSAARMYMFPWAYTTQRIPDADYRKMADTARKMAATNGFRHGPISTTIYVAPGSSADYYYWKQKSNALAVEVGYSSDPATIVRENAEATWIWLEAPLLIE